MSKQANAVEKYLRLLYPDLLTEVGMDKILNSQLHRGVRVDFYIPSIRCVVEVHGIQHFKESGFGRDKLSTKTKFIEQQYRDDKLVSLCNKFSINYVQVDYNEEVSYTSMYKKFEQFMEDEDDSGN